MRIIRKALSHLYIPQFKRMLLDVEVDHVIKRLDINGDGVLSAREFRDWLFPGSQHHSSSGAGTNGADNLAWLLVTLVDEIFEGDFSAFFDHCKG